MLLSNDLISVHLSHRRRTVVEGCNRTCLKWIRAARHIYGIICHTQGLYYKNKLSQQFTMLMIRFGWTQVSYDIAEGSE